MGKRTNLKTYLLISVFLVVVLGISGYSEAQEPFMVADINPGWHSDPRELTNVNGTLFFRAGDGTHGVELWKSDGTKAGTMMVADIIPGSGSSSPEELTNVNGTLFFRADDDTHGRELWKSDGTSIGTVMVADIDPGAGQSWPSYLTNVNGTLFFCADDGAGAVFEEYELWKSDGTEAGTVMVADINPGADGSRPRYLTNVNGTLFFTASDGTHGEELWKSDGTEAGTVMVADIRPGGYGSSLVYLTNVNGTLFFSADDGTHEREVWKSDGTEAGTVMVADINPSIGWYPWYLTNVNGTLFFRTNDGTHGYELWKSDGTEAGTVMVADINPGIDDSGLSSLTNVNGTLFLQADDGTHGGELWKSDASEAGTVMVMDINPSGHSYPWHLTNVNGTLFFTADDGSDWRELWKSDGTEAGTVMVADINPSGDSDPSELTTVNAVLFFAADDGTHGRELWAYIRHIFVDADASGANDGTSWADAYKHLQDALRVAVSRQEIWVVAGTYKPDQGGGQKLGDRTATFQLINGVAIYGGFPSGGSAWEDRNPNAYETILSGNIGLRVDKDNSYHVVTGSGTDATTILDGFTITAGNADGSNPYNVGGGMFNSGGSPTLTNCTFIGNSSGSRGGGMYNDEGSPKLVNCNITNNSAGSNGGGIYNYNSGPALLNCALYGNTAGWNGGGINNNNFQDSSVTTVINSVFSGNSAYNRGGGIFNLNNDCMVTNTSFYGNSAGNYGGAVTSQSSDPVITNCVLWGNWDIDNTEQRGQVYIESGTLNINHSCVKGWDGTLGGTGNIGDDPLFKDADGDDDIVGTEDDNLELAAGSPCIDAGDNSSVPADIADLDGDGNTSERTPLDLAGNARFTDDPLTDDTGVPATGYPEIVEMGAYERYEFCGDAGHPFPVGDVNRDCKVNFLDIAIIAAHWLEDAGPE